MEGAQVRSNMRLLRPRLPTSSGIPLFQQTYHHSLSCEFALLVRSYLACPLQCLELNLLLQSTDAKRPSPQINSRAYRSVYGKLIFSLVGLKCQPTAGRTEH